MGIAIRRLQGSPLWAIQSSYFSRALVEASKSIPGMAWDPARRSWVGYIDAVEATANVIESKGIRVERSLLLRLPPNDYRHHLLYAVGGAHGRSLREYQKVGVDFLICQAPTGAILADEMGCIDGEAKVRVCRAGRSFETSLAEFYSKFKTWAPGYSTKIRSLCDGVFRLNDVVDVLDKGIRPVFEIELASGKKLKATGDHEILTSKGYVPLEKIKRDAIVITNGKPRCRKCGSKDNVSTHPYAKFFGFCRRCILGGLRKNGRARPIGEVRDKDGYVRIGGHKGHPRANRGGQVLEHILVVEKRIGRHLRPDESVHHIDHVKHNNVDSNLKLTTKSAHARLHGLDGGFRRLHGGVSAKGGLVVFEPKEDRVVAVRRAGEAHVYDVVCADPYRNFVANGIVVHNCGKSAEAVVAVRAFGGKTLIVCPSSARSVWADTEIGEIAKWWPAKLKFIFQPVGTKAKPGYHFVIPDEAQIVVIHIDILYAWVSAILAWGPQNVVIDEAHLLQSEKSRRSKAAKEICRAPTVVTRIALTGTPLTNRVRDLWNLIDTVSEARFGKNFFRFGIRYADGHQEEVSRDIGAVWKFEGKSNLEELQKRLARFTLRRTKEEVKLELPPKTRQLIRMEVNANFRQSATAKIDRKLIQAVLTRAVDGKLPQIVSLVKDHLEAGASVVVFCFRRAVAEHFVTQVASTALPCRFIHGGVPQHKRDEILKELRESSRSQPVMLAATIDCTAVAIDLTFANVGVVSELTYEPHELLQAEARLHRFGQTDNVLIQYPIAMQTIEEAIAEVVIDRLDTFESLIGKTDGLAKALAGDESEDLIAQLGMKLLVMTEPKPKKLKTS